MSQSNNDRLETARMRRSRAAAACGAALLLAACAPIETSAIPPAMTLPENLSARNSLGSIGPELRSGWWRLAREPGFVRLVEATLEQNFALSEARMRLAAARIDYGAIGREFRPQAAASASIRQDNNTTTYPTFGKIDLTSTWGVSGFESSWEVDFLGRAEMERRAATASVESAEADLGAARGIVAAEVLRAYALLSISQAELKALDQALENTRRIVRLTGMKRGGGIVSDLDYTRAEAAQRRIEARRPPLLAEAAGLRAALGALAGTSEPFDGEAGPVELAAFRFASVPAELVHRRPDVRAAAASILKAAAERDLAEADLYPRLRISGELALGRGVSGNLASALAGSLGPQLQIPLFDLDLRQARLSAREKGLEATAFAYRDRVVSAVSEVRRGLAQLEQARAQIRRARAEQRAVTQSDRLAGMLYRGGSIDLGERLQSAVTLAESELAVLAARRQEIQAIVFTLKSIAQSV